MEKNDQLPCDMFHRYKYFQYKLKLFEALEWEMIYRLMSK